VAAQFPDGQLYVNLLGFDRYRPAVEPAPLSCCAGPWPSLAPPGPLGPLRRATRPLAESVPGITPRGIRSNEMTGVAHRDQ